MIMKANKQIGFIYKNEESIDKILKDGEVVFERGFLRERTTTTLPINFGGVGKNLKDYKIYGNTYQNSTTGKNLLNYVDNILSSASGLTNVINDDGSITTTGVPTSNYTGITSQHDIIDILEDGQTYTISSETKNQYVYVQINAIKIAGGTDYIYNGNSRAVQFTVNKSKYNKYNLKIQVGTTSAWGTNSRTITNKYQLEKGGTATEFEPYTGGQPSPNPDYPQEIVSCGDLITDSQDENYGEYKIPVNVRSDNLFDKDNANILNAYLGEQKVISSNSARCLYIRCEPNTTYTVHKRQGNRFAVAYSEETPTINSSARITQDNTASNITITTNNTANYLIVWYYSGTYDTTISEEQMRESVIIIEGSTVPLKYIPYYNETINIYLDEPLRKIGDYSDYIDFKNGKVVRNITEFILDGERTTNLYFNSASQNTSRIQYTSNPRGGSNDTNIFCNQLLGKLNYNADVEGLYVNDVSVVLRINKGKIGTSITTANEYFSINPLILNYILATPTEESITLPNIPTIDGNNTLNIETEITPSQVYIKYKSNT